MIGLRGENRGDWGCLWKEITYLSEKKARGNNERTKGSSQNINEKRKKYGNNIYDKRKPDAYKGRQNKAYKKMEDIIVKD